MEIEQSENHENVTAVVTAMTDKEQPFLHETLSSIISDVNIEQIVLCIENNNSWINSIVEDFEPEPRLSVIRMPIMPPGAVRNKALDYVRHQWIAYCDGDDVWCEGKTRSQLAECMRTGCDFVGADHCLTDEAGHVRAIALARHLPMTSSWMVRTAIMRQHPFNEALYNGEDGEWWIRTADSVKKRRLPKILLRYRVRADSLSSATSSKRRKAKIVAFGRIPVIGLFILSLTSLVWMSTRRKEYVWQPRWGNSQRG